MLKEVANKFLIWVLFFFFFSSMLFAEKCVKSPLNNLILNCNEKIEGYSFFVAGHIYCPNKESIYPANSIVSNISLLNNAGASLMVLLGDIIQKTGEREIRALKESFLMKLDFPVFNAPGNHDLLNREMYKEYFGKTFFSFQYSTELFVFLDSEISDGKIEGDQLNFIMDNIAYCKKSLQIKNIFIFSHRLLWAIGNAPYSSIIPFVNRPLCHYDKADSIATIILPQLKGLTGKKVYFMSGDVGCSWAISLFYEKDKTSNITYVATGINDIQRDMICQVTVDKSGKVNFSPISLTGQKLDGIEAYGFGYWKEYFKQREKKKVNSLKLVYFCWGIISFGLVVLLIIASRRSNL